MYQEKQKGKGETICTHVIPVQIVLLLVRRPFAVPHATHR